MSDQKLGRYELTRVLGKGAMGLVYEGRDPNLDRRVAIKTIKVDNLTQEEAAEYEVRFRTEARSAARLQHPNIVSVYDSDRDNDIAFLVMEFIQGEDLKHHLDKGKRYTLQQAASIMKDLLSALDYAHSQNIVHRDIKPANLLIEESGRIKLTDFGVARIQDSGEATRTKGTMVGTLKYMSPEQVLGLPIDSRSDLFAAGIVLYQLLTGTRPFDGTSDYEIIQKIVEQAVAAPSTINPQLPREMDEVVARALERSRDDRYPTAQEFNTALQAAAGSAVDATITPPTSGPRAADSSTWTSTMAKGDSLINTNSNPGTGTGLPSSTVTQEVELVYWKEIKDSEDPEEFQDFLLKFPAGIYSDLARRRLKRLLNPGSKSTGSETGTRTHLMVEKQAAPANTSSDEFEATRALSQPASAKPDNTQAAADSATPVRTKAPFAQKRNALVALASVMVLSAVGFGYQSFSSRPALEPELEPAKVLGATEDPKHEQAGKPASRETGTKAAAPTRSPEPQKTAAVKAAPKPQPKTAPAAPVTTSKAAPAPKPVSKPLVAEEPVAPQDPEKECEGRILLGYLTCMKDQCEKPNFAQHPVCVERRAMERRNRSNL